MVRVAQQFKPRTGMKIEKTYNPKNNTFKIPTVPQSATEFKKLSKFDQGRFKKASKAGEGSAFGGRIEGSSKFSDKTPGLFVQSIKGMEGKHYVEKGMQRGIDMFEARD